MIDANTLGFGGSNFKAAPDAASYIAAEHLRCGWAIGGTVTYCPATVPAFSNADFTAATPPSTLSASTPLKPIKRQWAACTSAIGYTCLAVACVDDPTTFQYSMKAQCPTGFVFDSSNGKGRCECPAGRELTRRADGSWTCTPFCTPGIDQPACYRQDLSCGAGNPVLPGIAAKVQTEVDYEGAGTHPLRFSRSFRSHGARPWVAPGGWSHWIHNWGRRVETYHEAGWRSSRAYVVREDASQLIYSTDGLGTWQPTQTGDRNQLQETRDSSGTRTGFVYRVWADDSSEYYNPQGQLTRVVQRNGWTNTLTYSGDRLVSVKNHFGRELRLSYDAQGRLQELLPPGAVAGSAPGSATSPIRYAHEEAAGLGAGVAAAGQLTSVTWQDGHRRTYHYENAQFPGWLTGRTDEAGVRIGTYVYDAYGRVQREFGPGGTNELRFRYINNTAELTDLSTGTARSTLYTYETAPGVIRPASVSASCPLCGSSQARTAYTAAGDVARSVGHDGGITFYSYDAKGRETERAVYSSAYASATTRPALNLAEHVVSTRWHATWNLPTTVAEPGKTSSYSYDSLGQVTSQSWSATTDATGAAKFSASKTGSTYTTAWTYDANRLNTVIVERTDSVETQRWTLAYNGMGDLARITDVTGGNLVGRGTSYDPNGRLLDGITDAGVVLRRQYSPRGFVASSSVDNETNTYMQNGVGLTTQVRMPDGQVLQYLYDANYQLTNVQLNGASITAAMLALADYPDTPLKALAARGRASLALAVEALISPAYAQSGQLLRRVVPIPGRPMPGQPEYDPRSDLIRMAPMSTFDRVALGIAERTARECECKPDGGYDRPTFTMVSFAHVLFSGHLSPRFSDKSYFATSEKVGQTLVDEIMTRPDERRQSERDLVSSRVVREVTLIRPLGAVGYARTANGTFVPTNRVRLVYERKQCDKRIRARNEVVTIFPI